MGRVGEYLKVVIPWHVTLQNQSLPDSTYAICDGSVVLAANHDLGGGNYTLPDMRNKFAHGADRTLASGSGSSNDGNGTPGGAAPAGSPGPRGSAGSMSHTLSSGEMPVHSHQMNVTTDPAHSHGGSVGTGSGGSHAHSTGFRTFFVRANGTHQTGTNAGTGQNQGADSWANTDSPAQPNHGGSTGSAGAHGHTVTIGNAGSGTAMDIRPRYHGLVYIMRVKN